MRTYCLYIPPSKRLRQKQKNYVKAFMIALLVLVIALCWKQQRDDAERREKIAAYVNELTKAPQLRQ
jgi:hypothetical protein